MEGTWTLEGTSLGDDETTIFITATERTAEVYVPTEAVRGASEVWERTGKSLKTVNMAFTILGRGENKFTWDTFIVGILENRSAILIESPEYDENYRILDTFRSVYIQPTGRISSRIVNASQIDIAFTAIVLGAPRGDGGSYESCAGYSVEFVDNDFWAATNTAGFTDAPLLGVPEQASGFVQATNVTTGVKTTLTRKYALIAAGDGVEGIVQVFDLAGYVFGTPHAEGNGGPAFVCESANQEETAWD